MKYSLLFLLTAALLAVPASADVSSVFSGVTVSGEALLWRPTGADLPIATGGSGNDTVELNHPYSPGYRVRVEDRDGWYAAWLDVESSGQAAASCPGNSCSSIFFPSGLGGYSEVAANSQARLQVLDLGLHTLLIDGAGGKDWKVSDDFGFRFARYFENIGAEADLQDRFVYTRENTEAYGLHVGLNADARVAGPIRFVGGVGFSLLDGPAQYESTSGIFGFTPTTTNTSLSALVPEVEMSAKLVAAPVDGLKVWLGWDFMSFANMIAQSPTGGAANQTVGFMGPSAGASWRF